MRALRSRARPNGERRALEARGVHRIDGRQARGNAVARVRPVRDLGAQSALHHCSRHLCRRANCQDSIHSGRTDSNLKGDKAANVPILRTDGSNEINRYAT